MPEKVDEFLPRHVVDVENIVSNAINSSRKRSLDVRYYLFEFFCRFLHISESRRSLGGGIVKLGSRTSIAEFDGANGVSETFDQLVLLR